MEVPVPFSPAFALLLLTLPGIWLLARALAHAVSRDRAVRAVLPAGLALALWILAVHVGSLVAGSLRAGLPAGMLLLAAAGIPAELVRRKRAPHDRPDGRPPSAWMVLTMLVATAAMAPLALRFHFHDEILLTGHMSIAAQLQNAVYPPRHLAFPDTPLRYHYGFDLLAASLTAILHVRVDLAIDVATLGLFALAWCLLWTLGERLLGRERAWLVPPLALFAGGLPIACTNKQPTFVGRVIDMCQVGTHYVNPPVSSYFFQHPWSLGIPVGLTALLVFTSHRARSERLRLVVLATVLTALSLSQVALFVACLPSFVVASAWGPDGFEWRRAARLLVVALAAAVAAKLLGGFFVSSPGMPGLAFTLQAGFGSSLADTLLWNAQTFGVLLPLGLVGFFALRRDRVVFGLLAAGSLLVLNTIRYEGSDDIMKYATLASIALAVLSAAALAGWLPERRGAGAQPPVRRTATALALAATISLSGVVFVVFMGAGWPGIPAWMKIEPQATTAAESAAIAWVRARIRPGELVYRNASRTYAFAQWGGLPQPWIQWTARAFGFPDARIAAREKLNRGKPADVETYRREGFRFFVLDRTREDKPMRAQAQEWITAGQARRVAELGELWVVELGPGP